MFVLDPRLKRGKANEKQKHVLFADIDFSTDKFVVYSLLNENIIKCKLSPAGGDQYLVG